MYILGIILILIGLSTLTGIHFFNIIFAIILVAIGVRLIVRNSGPGNHWGNYDNGHAHYRHDRDMNTSHQDRVNEVIVFSALNKKVISDNFGGGKVVMVFAGGELDLTQVKTGANEIDLEVSSVFSSTEIIIPKEWKVRSEVKVSLGNVDTHAAQGGDSNVTLVIHGEAVLGEIEVRNR